MMCGDHQASPSTTDVAAAVDTKNRRESTWSNRGGQDLVQVTGNVWCAERPFVWNGIDVGEVLLYLLVLPHASEYAYYDL